MTSILKVSEIQDPTNGNSALTVDSNGRILMPKQPRFCVVGNNAAYVTTSPVPFPVVRVDNTNSWSTSDNKYIVPVAGDYYFHFDLGLWRITGNDGTIYIQLKINGSLQGYGYAQQTSSGGGNLYGNLAIALVHTCAVGDEVQLIDGGSSSGGYYNNVSECRFSGFLLG